ncbi:hypothetical protein [Microbacterium aerolatum]|uniref:hypothetical protein n=1 Tax=Microbacterium aerolatum TaxID=153731 RepID=UPI00384B4D3D
MTVLARDESGKPTIWCDPCIAPMVSALNSAGVTTIASCCGHGKNDPSIALEDGRWLVVTNEPPVAYEHRWKQGIQPDSSPREAERGAPHSHKGEPMVWCETHQHEHIARMPRFTYLCKDCGWGQWYGDDAREHEAWTQENLWEAHTTYEVEHVTREAVNAEDLDRIMIDADGYWPTARDAIVARLTTSRREAL